MTGLLEHPTKSIERAVQWLLAFARSPGRALQFVRYAGVSAASLALDVAAFAVIQSTAVMSAALAGAVSCMVGLVLHYLLSAHLVFDRAATAKSDRRLMSEYALTGAIGFVITASAILIVTDLAGFSAATGKFAGIGLTFITVYLVRAGYVFAPARA